MRVAILNLTAGRMSGGYRKYLQHVVPMLRAEGTIRDMLIALPPGHEQQAGIGDGVVSWTPGEHWRGYPGLRERVRAWKPDVVFIPTARYINCQAPTLCMVQNMLPMLPPTFKNGVAAWGKLRLDAAMARRATRTADRVIAVSEYVRDFLVNNWNVPAGNVGVVYFGVDKLETGTLPSALRAATSEPFLFAAGSLYTYRGLEDAVQALPLLADSKLRLLIAGDGSDAYRNQIMALARELNVEHRITWLGLIAPSAMPFLYQQCKAFLMTSRVEACPNIALEAMASGARCISTSCAPMPEFFGEQALYYPAGDARALALHIDSVMNTHTDDADYLRTQGEMRSGIFTWEKTVNGVVRELKATLERSA